MLSFEAALVAAVVLTPLMLYAAYSDLRYLRLPNWLVIATFVAFVLIAVGDILFNDETGMSWGIFAWRIGAVIFFFILGFLVHMTGVVGGGDMKLLAALVPFVAPIDAQFVLIAYCVIALLYCGIHWVIRKSPVAAGSSWASLNETDRRGKMIIPVGVIFGITVVSYTWLRVASAL